MNKEFCLIQHKQGAAMPVLEFLPNKKSDEASVYQILKLCWFSPLRMPVVLVGWELLSGHLPMPFLQRLCWRITTLKSVLCNGWQLVSPW